RWAGRHPPGTDRRIDAPHALPHSGFLSACATCGRLCVFLCANVTRTNSVKYELYLICDGKHVDRRIDALFFDLLTLPATKTTEPEECDRRRATDGPAKSLNAS